MCYEYVLFSVQNIYLYITDICILYIVMNLNKTCKFIPTEHDEIFSDHKPSQFGAKVRHFKRPFTFS